MNQTTTERSPSPKSGTPNAVVDDLARGLATTKSRRTALTKAVGATLVGMVGHVPRLHDAQAKKGKKGKKPKKPKKPKTDECANACPSGFFCCAAGDPFCCPLEGLPVCCPFGCCPDDPRIGCGPSPELPCQDNFA